jgi:O-antigen/teichoic acid export membrane protein
VLNTKTARRILTQSKILLKGQSDQNIAGRTALFAFSIRIASAALAFLSQIFLARFMGSYEYGIYVIVWVWLVIIGNFLPLGLPIGLLKFIPELKEKQDEAGLRGILFASRLVTFALSSLIAALGIFMTWAEPDLFEDAFLLPVLLAAFCLPMMTLIEVQDGIARAHDWPDLAHIPPYIARPVLILIVFFLAWLAGFPSTANTAVAATIVATWLVALGQMVILNKRLAKQIKHVPRRYDMSIWIKASLPMLLVDSFFLMILHTDIMVAGWFLPPDEVAIYFAATKTLALVHFVYFAIRAATAHKISKYHVSHDWEQLDATVKNAVRWTFWPSLAFGIILLICGEMILYLFGEAFTSGYIYLAVLMTGVLIRATVGPAEAMLTMSGAQNMCALIYSLVFAVNLGLNLTLIPIMGLMGAAIATVTAMTVETVLLVLAVRKRMHVMCFIVKPGLLDTHSRQTVLEQV